MSVRTLLPIPGWTFAELSLMWLKIFLLIAKNSSRVLLKSAHNTTFPRWRMFSKLPFTFSLWFQYCSLVRSYKYIVNFSFILRHHGFLIVCSFVVIFLWIWKDGNFTDQTNHTYTPQQHSFFLLTKTQNGVCFEDVARSVIFKCKVQICNHVENCGKYYGDRQKFCRIGK